MTEYDPLKPRSILTWICVAVAAIAMLIAVVMLIIVGFGTMGRWQARANAHNSVKISAIDIQNQSQRIEVAKQKAQIRFEEAKGIREAQEEIAKTLTPLYVQFEMVDALKEIAASGSNNSVVYIPAGANGIPLVSNVATGQVGNP